MPLPPAYEAAPGAPLALRSSSGGAAPARYMTGSSKATATLMRSPSRYAPLGVSDDTDATAGGTPSTAMFFRSPSDRPVPGAGRARLTAAPVAASVIVPVTASAPA